MKKALRILGMVLLLLSLLIMDFYLSGWGKSRDLVTRKQFRETVIGKTPEEVTEAIGKPDEVMSNRRSGKPHWRYLHRTRDETKEWPDYCVDVFFSDGKVFDIQVPVPAIPREIKFGRVVSVD